VETALTHHLVSKYTSLVAVDKTPARPAGTELTSEQVANLLPYGQSGAAILGFPATATNAEVLRLTGLAALLAALLLMALPAFGRKESHELVH
jgi:Ca-activated chloride channel family protein